MSEQTLVLTHTQVQQKINRIAYQLYETNFEEEKIFVVGVARRGYVLAERIYAVLKEICDLEIEMVEIRMHKDEPLEHEISLSVELDQLNDKAVVLVDDVLNSGRTLIYAVNHLLQAAPRRLNTVVLVDRRHRRFPIRADFAGLTLSTTLQEHITVDLKSEENSVTLH